MSAEHAMKHNRVADCNCPSCGMKSDGASSMFDDATPKPGDLSVCVSCAAVLAFTDDLSVRIVNAEELRALPFVIRLQLEAVRQLVVKEFGRAHKRH